VALKEVKVPVTNAERKAEEELISQAAKTGEQKILADLAYLDALNRQRLAEFAKMPNYVAELAKVPGYVGLDALNKQYERLTELIQIPNYSAELAKIPGYAATLDALNKDNEILGKLTKSLYSGTMEDTAGADMSPDSK
jgi:hypothetical protein